jgi:hypothetical protein
VSKVGLRLFQLESALMPIIHVANLMPEFENTLAGRIQEEESREERFSTRNQHFILR